MADDPREVLTRPAPDPDRSVPFGPGRHEVYEVYEPAAAVAGPDETGAGPRDPQQDRYENAGEHGKTARKIGGGRWLVLVHGGFWRSGYDRTHLRPLASALAADGHRVALLEYRGTGADGGGWPGTFDDVRAGLAALHTHEDVAELVLVGHSAGGHLALLLATHHPTAVAGVISLAGCLDLRMTADLGLGDGAARALLGGGPDDVPEAYAEADPVELGAPDAPVRLVHGLDDDRVPVAVSRSWRDRVGREGTDLLVEVSDCEHFGPIDPLHPAHRVLAEQIAAL